jgi:hypothetical protein
MKPECPITDPQYRHRCMRAVTVDRVWGEALPFLGAGTRGDVP